MAKKFRCPRPVNRLIMHRTKSLSGPFFQNTGNGVCIKSTGNYYAPGMPGAGVRAYAIETVIPDRVRIYFSACVNTAAFTGIEVQVNGGGWQQTTGIVKVTDQIYTWQSSTSFGEGDTVQWRYLGGTDSIVDCVDASDIGEQGPLTEVVPVGPGLPAEFIATGVAEGVWKALIAAADGTNTYSARDTAGTFVNSDGYVQEVPAYTIRPEGARTVENSLTEATEQIRTTGYGSKWSGKLLTSFPAIDLSSGTDFKSAWGYNSLTSFPVIDLSSGTDFSYAWRENSLTSFPAIDLSSGTDFRSAWGYNSLTNFPAIDLSSGTDFGSAWRNNSLTSFPAIDLSSGTNFRSAWSYNSLTSFPAINLSNGTDFSYAWSNNSLTSFPANMFDSCTATNYSYAFDNNNLNQTSVDAILVSIDTAGQSNGTLGISGGTNSAPGTAGQTAKTSLEGKGWTVNVNS